jgi:hypothetical protein
MNMMEIKLKEIKEIKIKAYSRVSWYALLQRKIMPEIFFRKPKDEYIYQKVDVIIRERKKRI